MSLRATVLSAVVFITGCSQVASRDNLVTVQPETTATAGSPANPAANRQIITQANFTAETGDMDRLARNVSTQVRQLGGYVAGFNEQRYAGNRRGGTWTIRLPNNHFETFVAWLDENATVVGKDVSTQDVSEEYVDLKARLENKKNTEQRLTRVLEDRTGRLEDILTVEKEIDRVREEVERLQGRMRYLEDRVAMCTVTLTVTTRVEYQLAQAPTFFTRVKESWWSSLAALRQLGEVVVLGIVRVLPWLPLLAVASYVGYRAVRWSARRLQQISSAQPQVPPIVHHAQ